MINDSGFNVPGSTFQVAELKLQQAKRETEHPPLDPLPSREGKTDDEGKTGTLFPKLNKKSTVQGSGIIISMNFTTQI